MKLALLLALALSAGLVLSSAAAADPICGDTIDFGIVQRCARDAERLAGPVVRKACDATTLC